MPVSKKDDMRAALECRQPAGAVPLWELGFYCWDQASGRHVVLGREFDALGGAARERALHENAEIILSVCEELHFAALRPPGTYWEVGPGQPAYWWLPADAHLRQTEVIARMAPDDLMLVGGSGGVFHPPSRGLVEFCYRLYDAPEEVEQMARAQPAHGLKEAARLRDVGVEAVVSSSDLADNHGPFLKPEHMARFVMPSLREWASGVREMGLYAILHTDGMIEPLLEDIASSGVHAIQAIDPVAGMDIAKVKRQVGGRLCLCGNVDCGLLLTGPPDKVYAQAASILRECKTGGGLVLGASNGVVPETPIENYYAMLDAWRDFGRYGA